MQRSIVAALVAISLGACSSEDGTTPTADNLAGTPPVVDIPVIADDTPSVLPEATEDGSSNDSDDASDGVTVIVVGSDTPDAPAESPDADSGDNASTDSPNQGSDTNNGGDDTADSNQDADNGSSGISDDAGSATSDGGETATGGQDASGDQDTGSGISDDAGSATSDGGEISDDAGSATSDGGEISDDAGSATSDGGEISDDAGSATSDGGQASNDDTGNDDDQNSGNDDGADDSDGDGQSDAADFESDNTGGSVIRRSVLAGGGQVNICTTASNQQNFSDTRIGDFILHNNAWRPWRAAEGYEWTQCIYTNTNGALAGWNYDWGPGREPNPAGDYYVRSYPELIYGVKDEFRTSAPKSVTGLPVPMSEMPNISISYSYDGPQYGAPRAVTASNNPRYPNGTTISGERNIAIESFLYNPDASGECSEGIVTRNGGSNHVYEVMVWLDAGAERLPAGPSDFVTDVNIRGEAFKVYTKGSDNRYIAFVAQNPQTSGTLVWNDFTDWARTFAHRVTSEFGARSNSVPIQDSWCVANIIVGTEIFWGAGNLDIYDWTITQSR